MATPGLPPTFSIASIDAQRVEEALARIGPKWTTWTAMTLAQVRGPCASATLLRSSPSSVSSSSANGWPRRTLTDWWSAATTGGARRTNSARSARLWPPSSARCRTGRAPTCHRNRWPKPSVSRTRCAACIFGTQLP